MHDSLICQLCKALGLEERLNSVAQYLLELTEVHMTSQLHGPQRLNPLTQIGSGHLTTDSEQKFIALLS